LENRKVVFLPRDIHNRFIKEVMDDNQGTLEWGELKKKTRAGQLIILKFRNPTHTLR